MLERLQQYAIRVQWLRVPFICLSVCSFLLAAYITIVPGNPDEAINDSLFIPAVLLFCWSVLCYCLISVFQVAVPIVDVKMGFFSRLVTKFRRSLRSIITLGFLALSIALVVVSFKLMTTGLG
jgi:hypothetical protein